MYYGFRESLPNSGYMAPCDCGETNASSRGAEVCNSIPLRALGSSATHTNTKLFSGVVVVNMRLDYDKEDT